MGRVIRKRTTTEEWIENEDELSAEEGIEEDEDEEEEDEDEPKRRRRK